MINYLPKDQKKQLRAARTNVLLFRYNIGLIFAVGFLAIGITAVMLILSNEKAVAENTIASNQAQAGNFTSIQGRADSFRKDLNDAKSVFGSEIRYSSLYLEISRLIPAGAALESLRLDPTQIGSPITLSVKIKGEKQAVNLLESFKNSPVFGNTATYGSLSANTGDDAGAYPYILPINVTINKDAAQ